MSMIVKFGHKLLQILRQEISVSLTLTGEKWQQQQQAVSSILNQAPQLALTEGLVLQLAQSPLHLTLYSITTFFNWLLFWYTMSVLLKNTLS